MAGVASAPAVSAVPASTDFFRKSRLFILNLPLRFPASMSADCGTEVGGHMGSVDRSATRHEARICIFKKTYRDRLFD
jgi:hypothetical protein